MDIINFEILEDGTITVKTSEISSANHMSADKLMADMETLIGGPVTYQKDPDAKAHAHLHKHGIEHAHTHK